MQLVATYQVQKTSPRHNGSQLWTGWNVDPSADAKLGLQVCKRIKTVESWADWPGYYWCKLLLCLLPISKQVSSEEMAFVGITTHDNSPCRSTTHMCILLVTGERREKKNLPKNVQE